MKLLKDIYLVGSGEIGLSHPNDCHVYLIDGGDDAVLIDAGVGLDNERIRRNIEEHINIGKVSRVLLSHIHADHSGGAEWFQNLGIKIYVSSIEAEMLARKDKDIEIALELAKNAGAYPKDYKYKYFKPDGVIEENQKIKVGRYDIKPIHTRGHSPGLLCFYVNTDYGNVLFSSDQVFMNGAIGLLNAPGSGLNEYREDIIKLKDLSVDVLLPGHRLFTLKNGQQHIDMAIENLSKVFTPLTF